MNITQRFMAAFGATPETHGDTPGRVNLIGEHIDYNGGTVMPMAIDLCVAIAIGRGQKGRVQIVSAQFPGIAERAIGEPASGDWSDYALGALARFGGDHGWRVAIDSAVPAGSGLSTSAAVTVGILRLANALVPSFDFADPRALALAAKEVENAYIGVPCGVMDQMAVAALQPGQCMTLDTDTLQYESMAIPDDWRFVIHHSGVVRRLNEGRYAERRAECESARSKLGRDPLCRLPLSALHEPHLSPIERARARHAITEHARVLAARDAMTHSDIHAYGALMDASHASMREDFEITTPAVDAVVAASRHAGAIGARMTGGGFGGCIVSLVPVSAVDAWQDRFETAAPTARFVW